MGSTKDTIHDNMNDILRNLNELRIKQHYCDIIVKIEDKEYPCHRAVLASVSEYFHSLFTSSLWNESAPAAVATTTLENVSPQTFEIIIDFAYSGILNITEANAFVLLKCGDFLRMPKFLRKCIEYIENHLNAINILDIYLYAIHPLKNLSFSQKIAKNIASKFAKVAITNEFLNLPFNALVTIVECISHVESGSYCASCNHTWQSHQSPNSGTRYCTHCGKYCEPKIETKDVLKYLMQWINYNPIERKMHLRVLATYVKIPIDYIDYWEKMLENLELQYLVKIIGKSSALVSTKDSDDVSTKDPENVTPKDSK